MSVMLSKPFRGEPELPKRGEVFRETSIHSYLQPSREVGDLTITAVRYENLCAVLISAMFGTACYMGHQT